MNKMEPHVLFHEGISRGMGNLAIPDSGYKPKQWNADVEKAKIPLASIRMCVI